MAIDATVLRRIRNQIPDADPVFGVAENEYMLDNQAVEDFYTDASETHPLSAPVANILRAAAFACLAISASEAIVSKVIRTQDLQTNGAVVAAELRQRANVLFEQADKIDLKATLDYFEIIDFRQGWGRARPELTEYDINSQENNF